MVFRQHYTLTLRSNELKLSRQPHVRLKTNVSDHIRWKSELQVTFDFWCTTRFVQVTPWDYTTVVTGVALNFYMAVWPQVYLRCFFSFFNNSITLWWMHALYYSSTDFTISVFICCFTALEQLDFLSACMWTDTPSIPCLSRVSHMPKIKKIWEKRIKCKNK